MILDGIPGRQLLLFCLILLAHCASSSGSPQPGVAGSAIRVKGGGKTYHSGVAVQDKCHLVRLPWYQIMTSLDRPRVAALEDPQSPGIS